MDETTRVDDTIEEKVLFVVAIRSAMMMMIIIDNE